MANSKEVVVTIAGSAHSGKTFTSVVIEKALQDAGFNVTLIPNMDQDMEIKRRWLEDPKCSSGFKDIFSQIHVTIVETQLSRNN